VFAASIERLLFKQDREYRIEVSIHAARQCFEAVHIIPGILFFRAGVRAAFKQSLVIRFISPSPSSARISFAWCSEEYTNMMADVAADAGLYVEFSDKALQDRYSQRREAAQAGRDYFTKSKTAQSGGQSPKRDQPKQATQREYEQEAHRPDHGR
jgi:hypothetical protein